MTARVLLCFALKAKTGGQGGDLELDKPLNCIIHHGSLLTIVTNAGTDACCLPSLPTTYHLHLSRTLRFIQLSLIPMTQSSGFTFLAGMKNVRTPPASLISPGH
jgi:hypothetical protein